MRKVLLLSLLATVGAFAAVASPAQAVNNVSTQLTTLAAPQTMPILFGGTPLLYGQRVNQGDPIPTGSAVVKITVEPLADQQVDAYFTVPCPRRMGAMSFGQPAGVPGLGGGFDAPLGERVMQFRFVPPFTAATGFSDVYMLCLPRVTNAVTTAKLRIAPVTFPGNGVAPQIKAGARLGPGQIVRRNRLVGIRRGRAMFAIASCPQRYQPVLGTSGTKGVKATLAGDVIAMQPTSRHITRATVYTVCQTLAPR